MSKKKLGIIGGGNMGEAIIARSHTSFITAVCEKRPGRRSYLVKKYRVLNRDLQSLARGSHILVIAVKPQEIDGIMPLLRGVVHNRTIIISIAAGISTRYIERGIGGRPRVVRAMPNMPASIGQGITAICRGRHAANSDIKIAVTVLKQLGKTVIVPENLIDSVTAVSGSGPAYQYLFMECFIEAAKRVGLPGPLAAQLVTATCAGSINVLIQKGLDPRTVRKRVTSKGGTTQAALDVFSGKKMDTIIEQAVRAARSRARALARQ